MNKKKKDFFEELRNRNVWREIKAYLLGGAGMIPLIWLITGLLYPDDGETRDMVTKVCTIIFASFLPSVFLFAYHHGESKDTPWSKQEKIWIPINVIAVFFIVLVFYNNDVVATTETTKENILNLETGQIEEMHVPKQKYRKKILIGFFENLTNDSTLDWMNKGIPFAIDLDLRQDNWITTSNTRAYNIKRHQEGYEFGDKVLFTTYLENARRRLLPYFFYGTFNKINNEFVFETKIHESKTGREYVTRTFQGSSFFKLVDEIALSIRKDLGLSTAHIDSSEDLSVTTYLTESLLAYEYFIKGETYSYKDRPYTFVGGGQNQINLYNKAISIDKNFALAYWRCVFRYESGINKKDSFELYWKKVMTKINRFQRNTQYYIKYRFYLKDNLIEEANAFLKHWSKLEADSKSPHSYLASNYRRHKKYKEAIIEYKKILEIDSEDYSVYSSLGFIYNQMNDYKNALKYKKKYAEKYTKDTWSNRNVAFIYEDIRKIDSAKIYFSKAQHLDPINLWNNRSLFMLELKANGKRVEALKNKKLYNFATNKDDSLSITSTYNNIYFDLGMLNKYETVQDSLKKLWKENFSWGIPELEEIEEETTENNLLLDRGNKNQVKIKKEKYKRLISKLKEEKQYSDRIRNFIDLFFGDMFEICIHEIYQKEDEKEIQNQIDYMVKKEEEYKQNYQMYWGSDSTNRVRLQAKVYAINNEYDKAITLLEKIKTIASYDSFIIQLARYYHEIKEYSKAEENFNLVFKTNPYDPKLNYYAALLYYDWDKKEEAKKHLNITLDIWKDADKDYIFSNMAKATSKEWESKDLP